MEHEARCYTSRKKQLEKMPIKTIAVITVIEFEKKKLDSMTGGAIRSKTY